MVRRAIAAGAGLLVVVLLVLGVRGCLNARKESAFKDYMESASGLIQESNQQSSDFFNLLREPGNQGAVDLTNAVNAARAQADQLVDRAKAEDHPDELNAANDYLVETLEFRADGIRGIADQLRTALGDEGREQAIDRIAAQMRNFDASDVIYQQRFIPAAQAALNEQGLLDEVSVPRSQFLPDIDWLRPTVVADRLSAVEGGGGERAATPGLHGTGLGTVTVQPSGAQLQPDAVTEVPVGSDTTFDVQIQNQGENDERDVTVRLSISGAGRTLESDERLDAIAQGETKSVNIPLAGTPATGRPATVKVVVEPVPGEEKTDNNEGEFRVVFTR